MRKKEKDLQLALPNSNSININLSKDNIQLSDIKLEQKSSDIKLDTSLDYPKQSVLPAIKDISSEIKKWENISGIGNQAFSRFVSLSLKPESTRKYHFRNFQSVKSQIQKWYRNKSQHQTRTHNNAVPQLPKEQRNSLKVIYNLYAKLNEFKSQLSSQMQQLGIKEIKRQETQFPSYSTLPTVSQSLDWIGWSDWTVRIHKKPNNYSREEFDTKSWGPWSQNPYANFYETEDEFQKDIAFANKLRTNIFKDHKYSQVQHLTVGYGRHSKHQDQLFQQFKNLAYGNYPYNHVIVKVAHKLLSEMGQSA